MAQKLVLFEEVLNGESILKSKETQAICNHVFGECKLSLGEFDKTDDLQFWAGDELYKAMSREYCSVYRVKASFDDLKNKGADEKFCGEVRMWLFEPDGTFDDHIVVITCMSNGLLKNENHVIGLISTDSDIENKVEEL